MERYTKLYLVGSAIFCVLLVAGLTYGDRRLFGPLMLFAIALLITLPLPRRHR